MTVSDMEIYESQRQYLESLGLLSCSTIYYEQLCDSFIIAVESAYVDSESYADFEPRGEEEKEVTKDGQ